MSTDLGIRSPAPQFQKLGLHSHPKITPDGKLLKPYANSPRVKVTDAKNGTVIVYFDLHNEDARPLRVEYVKVKLLELAQKKKRAIVVTPVFILLAKCGKQYFEVRDPSQPGNCIIHELPRSPECMATIDGQLRILGKDDYWYLPATAGTPQPIQIRPYWDAAKYL